MSWGIVSMISEPDPLVLAWVAHNLRLGADQITIFLDGDHPQLEKTLAGLEKVSLTRVDPDHWPFDDPRPEKIGPRQVIALNNAYAHAEVDWLLHIDADEFLDFEDVDSWLAQLPSEVVSAMAHVAERFHVGAPDPRNIFDGVFRVPAPAEMEDQLDRIDGAAAPYLDYGVTGYETGKSFFRVGRGLDLRVHCPFNPGSLVSQSLPGHPLLHFDGLTALSWVRKKQRLLRQQPKAIYVQRPGWRAQFRTVVDIEENITPLLELYHQLKCLSPERLTALEELGLIRHNKLDLLTAVRKVFPTLNHSHSVRRFERTFSRGSIGLWFDRIMKRV